VAGIRLWTILGVAGIVITAGYILWMLQRVFYGPPKDTFNKTKDADILERVYMFVFIAVIMGVGIYPAILTDVIKAGVMPIMGLLGG
jgi:NADH-quinone oxidoreductase subunit M